MCHGLTQAGVVRGIRGPRCVGDAVALFAHLALKDVLEHVLRLLRASDPQCGRGETGRVVIADARRKLIADVQALRWAHPDALLQRAHAKGLVANVAPHVRAPVEAAGRHRRRALRNRRLQPQGGLVEQLTPHSARPAAVGHARLGLIAARNDADGSVLANDAAAEVEGGGRGSQARLCHVECARHLTLCPLGVLCTPAGSRLHQPHGAPTVRRRLGGIDALAREEIVALATDDEEALERLVGHARLVEVSQQTFEADLVLFGSALVACGGDEGDGDAGEEELFEIPMGWRGMRRRVRDGEAW